MNNKGKATDVAAEGSLHPIPAIPSGRDGARRYAATVWSLILLTGSLPLMAAPPARVRVISQSGQFIVHGLPMAPAASSSAAVEYLRVDPNLVAVSLDRIRGAIYDELRLANEWRGRITVVTEPVVSEDSRVEITAARFQDGWGYRLVLPELVQRKRFLDAAVNVILLEVANRHASERKAELPLWLVQGLSAEIEATAFSTLALEPGAEVNRRGRNPDALAVVRETLRQSPGLNFDDLAMPGDEHLSGAEGEVFRACAQLFVHSLLRLHRGGRETLRNFVVRLPANFNWQTTFLETYRDSFPRLVDVDKWYSLHLVQIGGRDALSFFSLASTAAQLEEILSTAIEVPATSNNRSAVSSLRLQALLTEWEFVRQHQVLVEKIRRLRALEGRSAPEAAGLIADYAKALLTYVGPNNLSAPTTEKQRSRLRPKGSLDVTLRRLEELDLKRATLPASARAVSVR